MSFLKRNWLQVWQVLYLLFATSWLFAPYLNNTLSDRQSSISQFMVPGMPYAWLFKICEFIGIVLLFLAINRLYVKNQKLNFPILLLGIFGLCAVIDLIAPTTCHVVNEVCQDIASKGLFTHDIESMLGALVLFALTAWDAWKNRRPLSQVFTSVQIVIGLMLITNYANNHNLTTLVLFFYQSCVVVWIAWFIGTELEGDNKTHVMRQSRVNKILAAWVGFQGIATILIGSFSFEFFQRFNGNYLGSQAILFSHHSFIIGIAFLYLSRQIARGERRAWQFLIVLIGFEVIKYSVILPQPIFLAFYSLTFIGVFIARDFFNRSVLAPTWRSRLYDLVFILGGALLATATVTYLLSYTSAYSKLDETLDTAQSAIIHTHHLTQTSVNNRLLAHMLTALGVAVFWFVLWALFRPATSSSKQASTLEIEDAQSLLNSYSNSSEDFFKLWPTDKEYFWSKNHDGFVAYKVVGPIAFALADPITKSPQARRRLLDDFTAYCQTHGWRVCYLLVSEKLLPFYERAGLSSIPIGASAVINIQNYVNETAGNKWWRWQRNKGRRENYTYELLVPPHNHAAMQNLRAVSNEWLHRNGHQEESFALGYFNTEYLQRCRIHVLKNSAGQIVAFVNEILVFNQSSTTTIDLIRFLPDAPNANNYLLYCMLHELEAEDHFKFFDIGFVPLAQMKGRAANIARTLGANRFSAAGLEQFKNKFEPDWKKNYIAYDGDIGDLALIALHLEKAMAVDKRDLGK